MFSASDLRRLGEKISRDFQENNIPLTEGLEKVASDNGLNKNQIDRVAEVANVKTHLDLLRQGSDPYVKFDIANPGVVKTASKSQSWESNYDYKKPPSNPLDEQSPFKLAGFTPKEEIREEDLTAKYKASAEKRAELQYLQSCVVESDIQLETLAEPIYSLCKQASLSGTSTEDLQYVIKQASPLLGDYIIDNILKPNLEKDRIDFSKKDISKYANRRVNPSNELYQAVQDYHDEACFLYHAHDVLEEKTAELKDSTSPIEKKAFIGLGRFIGTVARGTKDFIKNHPFLATGGAAYVVGRRSGRHRERMRHMPLATQDQIQRRLTHGQQRQVTR